MAFNTFGNKSALQHRSCHYFNHHSNQTCFNHAGHTSLALTVKMFVRMIGDVY